MIPAPAKALWLLLVISVFLMGLLVLFGYIAWSSRNVRFEVSPAGLRIRGDLFGRMIPARSLRVDDASVLDLNCAREYRPKRRTFGTGLPGYGAGWFKLRNGEKALLFVTDRSRIVRIPTRDGYSVMLSVAEPDKLLAALRQVAGS
jgi:hypothetical protein